MRTPLTVATGLVLLAGVVVGVTTTAASADDAPAVQPIRVEAPPVPGAVADVDPTVPVVPELPTPAADAQLQAPEQQQQAPEQQQQQAPEQQQQPRDPNGYVAPPPADDDDDDGDGDGDGDGDDDDAGDDADDDGDD